MRAATASTSVLRCTCSARTANATRPASWIQKQRPFSQIAAADPSAKTRKSRFQQQEQRIQQCRTLHATPAQDPLKPVASSSTSSAPERASSAQWKPGPAALYEERVETGLLRRDDHQLKILEDLQSLYDAVLTYEPPPVPDPAADLPTEASRRGGIFSNLFGLSAPEPPAIPAIPENVPKSLYLFGDVGCGKSMLMDLLYECLPDTLGKRRVHFHAFMIDVHKRLHRMAAEHRALTGDAIVPVAREIARECRILCFDEFQVTDIADAMILRRLLESLMGYGFIIIMTSNRAPDDLYKNGIQRTSFVPCIELLKLRCVVKDLDSKTDYRKLPRALSKVYYHPVTPENRLEFSKLFEGMADGEQVQHNRHVDVWGRKVIVPCSTSKIASFSFEELCGQPRSAADYIEIVSNFETIFIENIPQLTLSERDQARRFILFIDAAYESKTKLLTLSDVPIQQTFSDKRSAASEAYSAHQRSMMDDLGLNADTVGASSIFTGDEEVFAFARAVSRLHEMGTRAWAERVRGGESS